MKSLPKKIRITLTEKDCKGAAYINSCGCPVANAFKRRGFSPTVSNAVTLYESNEKIGRGTRVARYEAIKTKPDLRIGSWGRLEPIFIKSLIERADKGETFRYYLNFELT